MLKGLKPYKVDEKRVFKGVNSLVISCININKKSQKHKIQWLRQIQLKFRKEKIKKLSSRHQLFSTSIRRPLLSQIVSTRRQ